MALIGWGKHDILPAKSKEQRDEESIGDEPPSIPPRLDEKRIRQQEEQQRQHDSEISCTSSMPLPMPSLRRQENVTVVSIPGAYNISHHSSNISSDDNEVDSTGGGAPGRNDENAHDRVPISRLGSGVLIEATLVDSDAGVVVSDSEDPSNNAVAAAEEFCFTVVKAEASQLSRKKTFYLFFFFFFFFCFSILIVLVTFLGTNSPAKNATSSTSPLIILPTNPPTTIPTSPPTNRPTNPPTNRPSNPPTNPPTNLPTNPPTKPPTNPPTRQPTRSPTRPPTRQPIKSNTCLYDYNTMECRAESGRCCEFGWNFECNPCH